MINLNDDETSSAVQTFSHEARLLETTRTQTLSEKSKTDQPQNQDFFRLRKIMIAFSWRRTQ